MDQSWRKCTFKLMLHKRHFIFRLLRPHLLHPGTEARDRKDNYISNLPGAFDAGEMLPRDILSVLPHNKVFWVIEKVEDRVRPHCRPRKLDDTLVELRGIQVSLLFHPQSFLGDGSDDVAKHRVTWLGLNSPLAELNSAGVPVLPIRSVRIGFDANDETDCFPRNLLRDPFGGRFQCGGVNVGVDATAGEEDEVAEEICFQHGKREGVVCFDDVGKGGVQVADQVSGNLVGDDFVDEAGVQLRPACFGGSEVLVEVA